MSEEINETTGEISAETDAVTEAVVETVQAEAVAAEPAAGDLKERGRRQEKIGIVTSDKMQKTVVIRVDRLVMHPVYKRYVRRRAKFMAHNELGGLSVGDQVRIVETRPLSAMKRWRVVEILRKAAK